MKKSEFKTLIREIVREEVKMELRRYLSEFKMKQIKEKTIKTKPKKIKTTKQIYTKNKPLNDILNETAMSDEWKTYRQALLDMTTGLDSNEDIAWPTPPE